MDGGAIHSRQYGQFRYRIGKRYLIPAVQYALLVTFGIVFIVPVLWMISTSLKATGKEFTMPPQWIPDPVKWGNYPTALTKLPFYLYFRNTMIVVVFSMIGTLLTSSMAGYAFAHIRFPLRDFWFGVLLSTMMLPGVVTLIPTYVLFAKLQWVNTFLPLIVPSYLGGSAFYIFLLRQYFMTIPYELQESARVDGASTWRILWQIMLPLAKPALGAVGIFSFLNNWNAFMDPLIYLNSEHLKTMALGLRKFQGFYASEWNLMMAAATTMLVPVLIIFFSAQRYFVRGIAMTGFGGR